MKRRWDVAHDEDDEGLYDMRTLIFPSVGEIVTYTLASIETLWSPTVRDYLVET